MHSKSQLLQPSPLEARSVAFDRSSPCTFPKALPCLHSAENLEYDLLAIRFESVNFALGGHIELAAFARVP